MLGSLNLDFLNGTAIVLRNEFSIIRIAMHF